MIEEITIKFGMELKPTQNSCKLQLYITNKVNAYINYIWWVPVSPTSKVSNS